MKKLKKGKKKLAPGGLLTQQQPPVSDTIVDATATAGLAAAGLGPLAAPLVQGSNMVNKAIVGDGTSAGRNAIGQLSPLSNLKSLASGNFKEAIPIYGAFEKAKRMKGEKMEAEAAQMRELNKEQGLINQTLMQNASFKHGGEMLSKRLGVVEGGSLNAISDDAVEVKANEPSKTDSVELQDAFVDNNEVIDRSARVFSDSIKTESGRTVAKEAKRLEKMKGEDARFSKANEFIDSKLDNLFNYQEAVKPKATMKGLKNGGKIKEDPIVFGQATDTQNSTVNQMYKDWKFKNKNFPEGTVQTMLAQQKDYKKIEKDLMDQDWFANTKMKNPAVQAQVNQMSFLKQTGVEPTSKMKLGENYEDINKLINKRGFKKGGKLKGTYAFGTPDLTNLNQLLQNPALKGDMGGMGGSFASTPPANPFGQSLNVVPQGNKSNLGNFISGADMPNITGDQIATGVNTLATVLPNIVNQRLQKKLAGPAAPRLQNLTKLKRVDPASQLASTNRNFKQAEQTVRRGTGQGANLASATGNLLAKRLEAENQIYGQTQNINANIANQEAGINTNIKGRNLDKLDQFNQNKADFTNKKLGLTSENVANLSGKIQAMGRERNQMQLDREKYAILSGQYGDLPAEMREKYPNLFKNEKLGGKYGGKIKKLSIKKKK